MPWCQRSKYWPASAELLYGSQGLNYYRTRAPTARFFVRRRSRRLFRVRRSGSAGRTTCRCGANGRSEPAGKSAGRGFYSSGSVDFPRRLDLPGPISIHLLPQPHPELKALNPKPLAEIKAMGLFANGSGDQLNLGAIQGFGFGA